MGGQATMVPLNDGQTASGTFETGLATLSAGEIWFVWADSGSWTEKVTYEARSCAPTALTLTSFAASSSIGLAAVCQKGVVTDFLDAPGGHVVYVVREGHSV